MTDFTIEQKEAFLSLAKRYDGNVYEIATRTDSTEITVISKEEAVMLEAFSSKVCDLVLKDHPDYDGKDEDINADAEMVTYMISDILSDSDFA